MDDTRRKPSAGQRAASAFVLDVKATGMTGLDAEWYDIWYAVENVATWEDWIAMGMQTGDDD